MNRQFFNYILFSSLILSCFSAGAQGIQAEAKLQQYTIRIGDQTKLFLVVHQPVKEHVNFPKLADTVISKVQIVSAGKPDTLIDQNDKTQATITHSYTITSFDAGTYTLPAFAFGSPGGVVKTNELTLVVQSVKVDTTKAIYDIKQPLAVTYSLWDWLKDNWYWVVLGLFVIVLIIGIVWYLEKKPKVEPVIKEVKPNIPPHTIALGKLNDLRDKKLWQQEEYKLYYIELSDILREYLEKRYVIKTHEKTTEEIFTGLRYVRITEENRDMLKQVLLLADLVKFAKEKPLPAENEHSMNNAIDFVIKTQQTELSGNTEIGGANV